MNRHTFEKDERQTPSLVRETDDVLVLGSAHGGWRGELLHGIGVMNVERSTIGRYTYTYIPWRVIATVAALVAVIEVFFEI